MKLRLKNTTATYFNNWWVPSAICLALLIVFIVTALPHWRWIAVISNVLFVCLFISLLGILLVVVRDLIKKRWAKGVAGLVLLFVCGVASFIAMAFLMFTSMFGPSEDGFADNLTIPANIEFTEPMSGLDTVPGEEKDTFQQSLLTALSSTGNDDPTISADVNALMSLHKTTPEALKRYLATSPSWRVFKEHGNVFATRRWMIGSIWRYSLHGYYTRHDIDTWPKTGFPDFQLRITIGLSGKPWWRGNRDTTWMTTGEEMRVKLSEGNQMKESHCVISMDSLVLEVFEQSITSERRLTKAALAHLGQELDPMVKQPDWRTIRSILPAESIKQGDAVFELRNSFQPGLYDSEIWINPGEPGMVYLKAFEVTKGTPLSVDRLKEKSNEWIGWSNDPKELFFSNTHFTIYEGDWGKPYAARFEVWFAPNSGKADHKLMEKVFKIEGWQR